MIPVAQFIAKNLDYLDKYGNFYTIVNSIINENYKRGTSYLTVGQNELYSRLESSQSKSQLIVAPTSYGKTELILSFIEANKGKNICILTPTKSLLAQTKKRILNNLGYLKIITQPEIYIDDEQEVIEVLTQERFLRLLQENPKLSFDLLVVDEVHNLLEKYSPENSRSILLASDIIICYKRNPKLICKYLTPFLKSKDSIELKYIIEQPEWYSVSENVKSEIFYFYDVNKNVKQILDQFSVINEKLITINSSVVESSDSEIVAKNAGQKNIIYLNTPRSLVEFADELSLQYDSIEDELVCKAVEDIKEYVHNDYKLARCLNKGNIYHHGAVLEAVRYYIEDIYSSIPSIKMLIANSTLLEGVNIPATKMFILDQSRGRRYLSPSSLKNLIGRVCRFGEVFNSNSGNLDYLLPEIYFVKGKYCRDNFNALTFVKE